MVDAVEKLKNLLSEKKLLMDLAGGVNAEKGSQFATIHFSIDIFKISKLTLRYS